jgi:hypothetical protein
MNKNYSLIVLFFLSCANLTYSQQIKFYLSDTLQFLDANGLSLSKVMSGGFNCPQFSPCDLNGDGKKDMVVYEKQDGSITTFINKGAVGEIKYELDNRYAAYFPKFRSFSWMLMRDFNNDGYEDIFTMGTSGYVVYKNISYTVSGRPEFVELPPLLYRNFSPSGSFITYNPLSTPSIHLPGIYDIDFDGDLDIMSYSNVGGAITLWKNFQVEENLPPDSMRYYIVDLCYGYFTDNNCNAFFLNNCADTNLRNYSNKRHTNGSSITLFDADNDHDIDMLLGNEGCSNMCMLYNNKQDNFRSQDSFFVYDTNFVAPGNEAHVSIYPAAYFLDLDNDGNRDLIYAPNSTNYQYYIESVNQIHWFKNIGTDSAPIWGPQKDLFTNEMLDIGRQSSWVCYDWDGDGDQDCIAANKGNSFYTQDTADRIFLYENIGTPKNAIFKLSNQDFGGFRKDKLVDLTLSIGDLDNDGKMDLICGNDRGEILYYRNTSSTNKTLNPSFVFANSQFQGISIDVGNFSAPAVADINEDGLLDLVIGNSDSMLSYFKNNGSKTEPVFNIVTSRFGGIKAFDSITFQYIYDDTFGIKGYFPIYEKHTYSRPLILDLDGDSTLEIMVSNSLGTLRLYKIGDNPSSKFEQIDSFYFRSAIQNTKFNTPDLGNYTGLAFCDLNGDSTQEVIVSNNRGGILYLKPLFKFKSPKVGIKDIVKYRSITGYPNPSNESIEFKLNSQNVQSIQMVNALGQLVDFNLKDLGDGIQLELMNLESGFYIVQILMNDGAVYCSKFQFISR